LSGLPDLYELPHFCELLFAANAESMPEIEAACLPAPNINADAMKIAICLLYGSLLYCSSYQNL
jgi:hypothetical protein